MPLQYVDSRRLLNIFFLWLVYFELCDGEYVVPARTAITDISAMCSSQGITSSIVFDGPFSGKIYSPDYATVRECIYYDGQNQENVLFSIPVHRCGTRLTRTSRNLVDQMESRVYVQMEHEAQTALDQQFLFVCQLAGAKAEGSSIRRHPVAPSSGSDSYATAPEAIKPSQFRVSTHVRPVQGVTGRAGQSLAARLLFLLALWYQFPEFPLFLSMVTLATGQSQVLVLIQHPLHQSQVGHAYLFLIPLFPKAN
ncbi:hypothetical protein V3C99_000319 [Haemonchus contortus]